MRDNQSRRTRVNPPPLSGLEREDTFVSVDPRFEELYRAEYSLVFRSAYVLCGDRPAAEEAAQEAFARALARWSRLRDKPWAAGWVTTTALNVARRALRRRLGATFEGPPRPGPGDDRLDESIDLWAAVRALPGRQREALVLHYVADRPVQEVARLMKCNEGTVKAHLAKARAALREVLGGQHIDR